MSQIGNGNLSKTLKTVIEGKNFKARKIKAHQTKKSKADATVTEKKLIEENERVGRTDGLRVLWFGGTSSPHRRGLQRPGYAVETKNRCRR